MRGFGKIEAFTMSYVKNEFVLRGEVWFIGRERSARFPLSILDRGPFSKLTFALKGSVNEIESPFLGLVV